MNDYFNPFMNFSIEELVDAFIMFNYDQDVQGLAWVCESFCHQVTLDIESFN